MTPAEREAEEHAVQHARNRDMAPRTAALYDRVNARLYGDNAAPLTSYQRGTLEMFVIGLSGMLDNARDVSDEAEREILAYLGNTD